MHLAKVERYTLLILMSLLLISKSMYNSSVYNCLLSIIKSYTFGVTRFTVELKRRKSNNFLHSSVISLSALVSIESVLQCVVSYGVSDHCTGDHYDSVKLSFKFQSKSKRRVRTVMLKACIPR